MVCERGGRTVITTSVRDKGGWVLFKNLYPERRQDPVFRLASSAPGGGRVEVWLSAPGDRYAWTEVRVPCDLPDGPVDLYVALSGAVWLDWFRV